MYQIAYDVLHNPDDAEDALQEAFIYIVKNISKISVPICPKTRNYVAIISRNNALTLLKKRKKASVEEIPPFLDDKRVWVNPEKVNEKQLVLDMVRDAIQELPKKYQDCLELSLFYDYTPREIADLLQVKEQSIYKRLNRGRKKLQERLKKRGLTYES